MKIKNIIVNQSIAAIEFENIEARIKLDFNDECLDYIYDKFYKSENEKLIINNEYEYSAKDLYDNSLILFKDEYIKNKKCDYKIWQAEIKDNFLLLTFSDYNNGIFYLGKILEDNKINDIKSFIINNDKIIINDIEISIDIIYHNSYKFLNKRSKIYDVDTRQQPKIKSFKWLSNDNNEMIIEFYNGEMGLYDFNLILYSDRYINAKSVDILRNDIKYLHEKLYCTPNSFEIDKDDDLEVIGYTSEEPIYFDTKLIDKNGKFIK